MNRQLRSFMKSLLLCTLFAGIALAGKVALRQTTCDCGWTNSGRIVGGKETKPYEYPWMAALTERGRMFCGGSIISPYHVLTAAHCGEYAPAHQVNVVFGAHVKGGKNQTVPVAKIFIHEGWHTNDGDSNNDISIVVTAREIQFTKTIGPVCMPTAPLQPALENKFIKVMGWGSTYNMGRPSDVLREVDLKVLPRRQCQSYWSGLENKLCAIGVKNGEYNKDSCYGDSGGPLVWLDPSTNRYTQAALVSYGGFCGGGMPSVNTDVSAYSSWINKIINTTKPGVKTCKAAKEF